MAGRGSRPRAARGTTQLPAIRWRALVGAALITAAVGGVVLAHRAADAPPTTRHLVAVKTVVPGEAISEEHLGSVAIDLPASVESFHAEEAPSVLGRHVRHRVAPSELLSPADLVDEAHPPDPDSRTVAITVDSARAPLDGLAPGDTVEVLVTDSEGSGTRNLMSPARIVGIGASAEDDTLGAVGGTRLRLSVPDLAVAREVVDAAVNDEVTIIVPPPSPETTP